MCGEQLQYLEQRYSFPEVVPPRHLVHRVAWGWGTSTLETPANNFRQQPKMSNHGYNNHSQLLVTNHKMLKIFIHEKDVNTISVLVNKRSRSDSKTIGRNQETSPTRQRKTIGCVLEKIWHFEGYKQQDSEYRRII